MRVFFVFMLIAVFVNLLITVRKTHTAGKNESVQISAIAFAPLPLSSNDHEKTIMRISPSITFTYDDKSKTSI